MVQPFGNATFHRVPARRTVWAECGDAKIHRAHGMLSLSTADDSEVTPVLRCGGVIVSTFFFAVCRDRTAEAVPRLRWQLAAQRILGAEARQQDIEVFIGRGPSNRRGHLKFPKPGANAQYQLMTWVTTFVADCLSTATNTLNPPAAPAMIPRSTSRLVKPKMSRALPRRKHDTFCATR